MVALSDDMAYAESEYHDEEEAWEMPASGPAVRPLDFPSPAVHRCVRTCQHAVDHRSGLVFFLKNILVRVGQSRLSPPPDQAYLIKKRLSKSIYGDVRLGVILRRVNATRRQSPLTNLNELNAPGAEWESTEEMVAIKVSSWEKMKHLRGRHLEDPIKEVAALELLGNYHPNVLGSIEVLQDDDFLYTIMPFCSGGDLYGRIIGGNHRRRVSESSDTSSEDSIDQQQQQGPPKRVDEAVARKWFRQLLDGLSHMQKKGVCHRDLSLENILVAENDRLVIIDMGMSLRVPFTDPFNYGCATDVSEGARRRLIRAQGQGSRFMYMAPEVVAADAEFDGFAIDLWSAGVVLFLLLVGMAPFKWAHESDARFLKISKGHLRDLLDALNIPLSAEACDLMQNLFWRDPSRRLSLAEVMRHPWVTNQPLEKLPSSKPSTKKVQKGISTFRPLPKPVLS